MAAPVVVVWDVVAVFDGAEYDFPAVAELFRGTVEEARSTYVDESIVTEAMDRLLMKWENRLPGCEEISETIEAGACGQFVIALEEPAS